MARSGSRCFSLICRSSGRVALTISPSSSEDSAAFTSWLVGWVGMRAGGMGGGVSAWAVAYAYIYTYTHTHACTPTQMRTRSIARPRSPRPNHRATPPGPAPGAEMGPNP